MLWSVFFAANGNVISSADLWPCTEMLSVIAVISPEGKNIFRISEYNQKGLSIKARKEA